MKQEARMLSKHATQLFSTISNKHPFITSYTELPELDKAILQSTVDPSNDVAVIYEDFVCINKTKKLFDKKFNRYYTTHIDIV